MLPCFRSIATKSLEGPAGRSLINLMSVPSRKQSTSTLLSNTPKDDRPENSKPPVSNDEIVTLPSGEQIGCSIAGPSDGLPLFFLHGWPSSRLEGPSMFDVVPRANVRLISPDRPGLGLSTHNPNRRLLDYPAQISALAKALNLKDGYHVMGGSGGGPYALACAKGLPPSEVKGVAVLAGSGPMDTKDGLEGTRFGTRAIFYALTWAPGLVRWITDWTMTRRARNPDPEVFRAYMRNHIKWSKRLVSSREEAAMLDEWMYKDGGKILNDITEILREHLRQGTQGFIKEGLLLTEPWGFRLEDIEMEGVKFYYGAADVNTPPGSGRAMANKMKNAVFNEYPGETHFSLVEKHGNAILKDFLGGAYNGGQGS